MADIIHGLTILYQFHDMALLIEFTGEIFSATAESEPRIR